MPFLLKEYQNKMKKLLVATCTDWPNLPANVLPMVNLLEEKGIKVTVSPWQSSVAADYILPLCTWDYAQTPMAFSEWLADMNKHGCQTVNPVTLMQWNMHKSYLQEIASWGIDVIPTQVMPQINAEKLRELALSIYQQTQQHIVVLKPLIGQSGQSVQKWDCLSSELPHLEGYQNGLVIQPYIQAIEHYGETSLIYFNGVFSHAVKRQPPAGEWRANSAYGVQIHTVVPSQQALDLATALLDKLPHTPIYARVDGTDILADNRFLLNELEVIEPALYLHTNQLASERFANVLLEMMGVSKNKNY